LAKAALLSAAYALFHVPDLVQYGSKPLRQLGQSQRGNSIIANHLRSFDEMRAYAPSQVFIGNLAPSALDDIERPWYRQPVESAAESGPLGRVFDQRTFYERLRDADVFRLVHLDLDGVVPDVPGDALPLHNAGQTVGWIEPGHPLDESQTANVMLENLACKATAVEAARLCLGGSEPQLVDYVLNTGEEAVGDRYQRGGGNLAKAVAEACNCRGATGADIKAFCCAPTHALVMAAAFVEAGVYHHVLVVGGGSLAKLGMKFEAHLRKSMPILEDTLAAMAFLIGPAEGCSPTINLQAVGRHVVAAAANPQAVYSALIAQPLEQLGLRFEDVDKYAVELHDPDITEPAGSGNVPLINYRTIAALAVLDGQIPASAIPAFVRRHGMPGFSPTQGHIASGVPYLGHARRAMLEGRMQRAMVVAKGSLFLGKMTELADGLSFMLEAA
jgi:glycine/sarcosine/betaine reductase complex component C subunit beta